MKIEDLIKALESIETADDPTIDEINARIEHIFFKMPIIMKNEVGVWKVGNTQKGLYNPPDHVREMPKEKIQHIIRMLKMR